MLPSERVQRLAFGIAIGLALACRVSQYAANTSLWHDEAFVALNVTHKSFAGLFGPLEWHESAPPAFLAIEKLVVALLGRSEYALRLVPLAAGLLGIAACAVLTRRVAAGLAGVWMMLMLAASEKLIVQSNEVKHFTSDLLVSVALTLTALAVLVRPNRWRMIALWGLVASVALWFSFATAFVFAGTSLALAPRVVPQAAPRARLAFLAANGAVAMSFAFLLAGPVHAQLEEGVLNFWSDAFPPMTNPSALVVWLARASLGFFNYFWQPLGIAVAIFAAIGGVLFWRNGRRAELLILTLPVAVSLVAAALHRWPFGGNQHMVFAAPAVLLLTGTGIEVVRGRLESWRRRAGAVMVTLVLLPGLAPAAYHVGVPRERHEARPAIQFLMAERRPTDQVLVYCPAEFEFYTGTIPPAAQPPDPSSRVWFIGTRSEDKPFPAQAVLDRLFTTRPLLLSKEAYGAASYLFGPESINGHPQ